MWTVSGVKLFVLRGHRLAVTSVAWKMMNVACLNSSLPSDNSIAVVEMSSPVAESSDISGASPCYCCGSCDRDEASSSSASAGAASQSFVPVVATCSDDNAVHVWDPRPRPWRLCHVLYCDRTSITGWFTSTYLALEEFGSRICIGTENGYLIVFDLCLSHLYHDRHADASSTANSLVSSHTQQPSCARFHNGSIEGLVWSSDRRVLATCSSDCTANVYSLPH